MPRNVFREGVPAMGAARGVGVPERLGFSSLAEAFLISAASAKALCYNPLDIVVSQFHIMAASD